MAVAVAVAVADVRLTLDVRDLFIPLIALLDHISAHS